MPEPQPDPNRERRRLAWLQREHEHLVQATRHLADWTRRVADQRIVVEDMRARGYDTGLAEALLETMQRTLAEGRRHRQIILDALARTSRP
ncbi:MULTISPECIES: hypothetical protein [Methylobacterium]|uniref:hypothetical protein n=1 Tax=Methylobacterium TaxID=407 RepID=UPI0010469AB6|nr:MULTISPECIES: hypothetical protein [Methylobacterium]MDR7035821.1 hypothetical protein [Methylobacterium sp. BE186]